MSVKREQIVTVRAINPASVVCPESILVNALLTLGVPEHPDPNKAYLDFREVLPDGTLKRTLQWTLLTKSRDGKYFTKQLVDRWHDPKWLAANPTHELAILREGLTNMLHLARRIAQTPHVDVLRRGKHKLLLPSHLPDKVKKQKLEEFEALPL